MKLNQLTRTKQPKLVRHGAVMPLFAFLLPVLFILSGVSINVAYMRLTKTQLQVAVDASAHPYHPGENGVVPESPK